MIGSHKVLKLLLQILIWVDMMHGTTRYHGDKLTAADGDQGLRQKAFHHSAGPVTKANRSYPIGAPQRRKYRAAVASAGNIRIKVVKMTAIDRCSHIRGDF